MKFLFTLGVFFGGAFVGLVLLDSPNAGMIIPIWIILFIFWIFVLIKW